MGRLASEAVNGNDGPCCLHGHYHYLRMCISPTGSTRVLIGAVGLTPGSLASTSDMRISLSASIRNYGYVFSE